METVETNVQNISEGNDSKKAPKKKAPDGPKKVKIKLFKDKGEYRDDVFVGVNGERFLIKRGVEVEVPDYVAEVIENSAKQDARAAEFVQKIEAEYAATNQ